MTSLPSLASSRHTPSATHLLLPLIHRTQHGEPVCRVWPSFNSLTSNGHTGSRSIRSWRECRWTRRRQGWQGQEGESFIQFTPLLSMPSQYPESHPFLSSQPQPKKWEPPVPTRVGKRKKRGPAASEKLPPVFPTTRCKLKMLKMERIKDYLLLEEGEWSAESCSLCQFPRKR